MRELSKSEISQVSGGSISDFAAEGGALGTVLGGALSNAIGGAMRGGAIGALAGATFGLTYYGTGWILENLS